MNKMILPSRLLGFRPNRGLLAFLTAASVFAAAPEPTPDPVVQWNRILLEIVRTPGVQPPTVHATRNFAIMHAAIYDAVHAIHPTHRPYAFDLDPGPGLASEDAAAVAAAHEVLIHLYPGSQTQLD